MINDSFIAFIPVRGGSKGIPLKNIKTFCGKPLVYWTIEAACKCDMISRIFVSTDDVKIRTTVEGFRFSKVDVIERNPSTATDSASTESALLEFANIYDFKHLVLIQATSPLLIANDLNLGIQKFMDLKADSLLSVVRQKRFIWNSEGVFAKSMNYDPGRRPLRQQWEGFLVENGAFYVTSKEALISSGCRISGKIAYHEMDEESYFEIDSNTDWQIAEGFKKKQIELINFKHIDFKSINLMVCDVDGVLTDAGMYYSKEGDVLKKFNTKDGKGIELLKNEGIKVMFLTSENTEIVKKRGEKLNIDYIYMNIKDKKSFMENFFCANPEFSFKKTVYIGDDINDIDCLKASIFSAAPADAASLAKDSANFLTSNIGGEGCVREVCDFIMSRRKNG